MFELRVRTPYLGRGLGPGLGRVRARAAQSTAELREWVARRRVGRPAGPRRQVLAGYLSLGPAAQSLLGLPTHLQLGDLRRADRLYLCWAEADKAAGTGSSAPTSSCGRRVRLSFPSGCVPPLPGPIAVWNDGVVGQVWGLRTP